MSQACTPQTVQNAQKFVRRHTAIYLTSLTIFLALVFGSALSEVLAFLIGFVVLVVFCAAPFVIWHEKLMEAQKVIAVWAKLEAEQYEAVMKRQLRQEMDRQIPADVRLRQLARQRTR